MIAELWRPKRPPSGAPYSYRKEKETWVDFLMVIMASGIARGCVCTTATAMPTTTSESRNMVAILQLIGGQRHAALVNHEFLPCTSLIFEISVMMPAMLRIVGKLHALTITRFRMCELPCTYKAFWLFWEIKPYTPRTWDGVLEAPS